MHARQSAAMVERAKQLHRRYAVGQGGRQVSDDTSKDRSAGPKGQPMPPPEKHGESLRSAIRLAEATLFGQDRDLRYVWVENPGPRFGSAEVVGRTDQELDDAAADAVLPAKRAALETGEPQRVEFHAEIDDEPRWFKLRIEPERDPAGKVTGLVCACVDITEQKRWEEHQRFLLLELAHRSKNLLAVVQGLANQTGKNVTSMEEFKPRFFGRLHSLARAHDILSDQNWRGAGLRELIRSQVLMYVGDSADRIHYEGPPVYLRPNAAQHVGLALHELTTNALRHGALKGPSGEVDISWDLAETPERFDGKCLVLEWREGQALLAQLPPVRSFGRILLDTVVPTAVGGDGSLEIGPAGVLYRLTIRPDELIERA